jgi:CopG family transcriptional regulator/antitoxin EndoAI
VKTVTVNIALPKKLLDEIDRTARSESRTRSELLREASRLYVARKAKWKSVFRFGQRQAKRLVFRTRSNVNEHAAPPS